MGRTIFAGVLARDQVDIFNPLGSFTRETGLDPTTLTAKVFVNNSPLSWGVVDGSSVADSSISAGAVYLNEIPGAPGFYALRFFPDRVGFWRIVLTVPLISSETSKNYDVVPSNPGAGSGALNASFTK